MFIFMVLLARISLIVSRNPLYWQSTNGLQLLYNQVVWAEFDLRDGILTLRTSKDPSAKDAGERWGFS